MSKCCLGDFHTEFFSWFKLSLMDTNCVHRNKGSRNQWLEGKGKGKESKRKRERVDFVTLVKRKKTDKKKRLSQLIPHVGTRDVHCFALLFECPVSFFVFLWIQCVQCCKETNCVEKITVTQTHTETESESERHTHFEKKENGKVRKMLLMLFLKLPFLAQKAHLFFFLSFELCHQVDTKLKWDSYWHSTCITRKEEEGEETKAILVLIGEMNVTTRNTKRKVIHNRNTVQRWHFNKGKGQK